MDLAQLISDLTDDKTFWSTLIGALVGGGLATLGATMSLTSARRTALDILSVQELQEIAKELPAAFNDWTRTVRAILDFAPGKVIHMTLQADAGDEQQVRELLRTEANARSRLQAWKHRLGEEGDYITREVDRAITAFLGNDRKNLEMALTASAIFVNANLPRFISAAIFQRRHRLRALLHRAAGRLAELRLRRRNNVT